MEMASVRLTVEAGPGIEGSAAGPEAHCQRSRTAGKGNRRWITGPSEVRKTPAENPEARGRESHLSIHGVTGRLELGNRAVNTTVVNNQFHQKLLGLIGTGSPVDSTAFVQLQTGLARFYPEKLAVNGRFPGGEVGPLHQYGESWTLCDPRHPADVTVSENDIKEDGTYTIEVLTVTPFDERRPERVTYVTFDIDRTIKVRGALSTAGD